MTRSLIHITLLGTLVVYTGYNAPLRQPIVVLGVPGQVDIGGMP